MDSELLISLDMFMIERKSDLRIVKNISLRLEFSIKEIYILIKSICNKMSVVKTHLTYL